MRKILLLAVAFLGAGHMDAAINNWLKITNLSKVPVKITVNYQASSVCAADEEVLDVGWTLPTEFIFDQMGLCAIDSIQADEVKRVPGGFGPFYWEVVRKLKVFRGSRWRKSFEFVGPDANGAFSFEECPKFCRKK